MHNVTFCVYTLYSCSNVRYTWWIKKKSDLALIDMEKIIVTTSKVVFAYMAWFAAFVLLTPCPPCQDWDIIYNTEVESQRYTEIIPTTPFSLVLRKEYFTVLRETLTQYITWFTRGGRRESVLVMATLAKRKRMKASIIVFSSISKRREQLPQ